MHSLQLCAHSRREHKSYIKNCRTWCELGVNGRFAFTPVTEVCYTWYKFHVHKKFTVVSLTIVAMYHFFTGLQTPTLPCFPKARWDLWFYTNPSQSKYMYYYQFDPLNQNNLDEYRVVANAFYYVFGYKISYYNFIRSLDGELLVEIFAGV